MYVYTSFIYSNVQIAYQNYDNNRVDTIMYNEYLTSCIIATNIYTRSR